MNDPGYTQPAGDQTPLALNPQTIAYLNEARKWAKFLSIMGFIGVGLLVILALFIGSIMNLVSSMSPTPFPLPAFFFTVIYLVIALLYFFPVLYLYRFSVKMEVALAQRNEAELSGAFENLKSVFKFMGIMTIVILSIYVLAIIFAIVAAVFITR